MDINLLQAKVADLRHLLSSQRDCLERLLFQLAFNSCSHINIVGSTGSGKSTLALAAAELFSEQYNIALLSTDIESDAFGAQLVQQWFGQSFNSTLSIAEQIKPESSLLPLLVVVDDAERLSESDLQALNQLPCLCISLSAQSLATANLILTLSKITLNDAEQLLQLQGLNQIELVNKFTLADGDLNLLLANQNRQKQRYRHHLSDLAHALKTPLTVLTNGWVALTEKTGDMRVESITSNFNDVLLYAGVGIGLAIKRGLGRRSGLALGGLGALLGGAGLFLFGQLAA